MNATTSTSSSPPLLQAPRLMRRMACWLYESTLLFGVIFVPEFAYTAITQTQQNDLQTRHEQQTLLFVVLALYFAWFGHKGQTLAMKTWRIKLVDTQGQRVSMTRALWRFVLSLIWFMPALAAYSVLDLSAMQCVQWMGVWIFVWALSSMLRSDKQFWHDVWAGTRLIDVPPPTTSVEENS
jgi:uncharacterized RDD family membrane protein YckC